MPEVTGENIRSVCGALKSAYAIIDQFADIVRQEIVEKQKVLPMSSGYEGLEAAAGCIGEALDLLGDEDAPAYAKRTVNAESTRKSLRDAYGACERSLRNAKPDSPVSETALYLMNCAYSFLNLTFEADARESIGRALEIYDLAENAAAEIRSIPARDIESCYLSPEGAKLHEELDGVMSVFGSLRPGYDIAKETEEDK